MLLYRYNSSEKFRIQSINLIKKERQRIIEEDEMSPTDIQRKTISNMSKTVGIGGWTRGNIDMSLDDKMEQILSEQKKAIQKIRQKQRQDIQALIKSQINKEISDKINIEKEKRHKEKEEENNKEYIMEKEINEENILEFIAGWEKGILKRHLKTQEEPKENKGPILEIVGKSFKREVLENDKDVMLVFYAPWCGHCKKLLPEYEKAANKLKEKNPKVVLARMDATENEVEGVEITGFPTIKFYPGDKKDRRPKDYSGERTMDGIIKFLQDNCVNKIVLDEEKKDEKTGDL